MRRALALAIVLAIGYAARDAGGELLGPRSIGLALGFALIAAALAGDVADHVRLPRVTGYLLFGLVCGPYLANIISRPMARELQIFTGLAVALIALIAGLEINFARMRAELGAMMRLGGTTIGLLYLVLPPVIWLAWPWLGIWPEAAGLVKLALVLLLTTLVSSFSPTVTIAVITESRAAGPLSQLTLAVVILGDLILILCFALSMQFLRWTLGEIDAGEVGLLPHLSWEIFGSFAFGTLVGALFALYLRHVGRELVVMVIAVCAVLSALGGALHFETVLAALAAGLVIENIAPPSGDAFREAVERSAVPVLIVFFVTAGASLQLDALAVIGPLAVLVAILRAAVLWAGTAAGTRLAAIPDQGRMVWMGLVSQAGVTLGLTMLVAAEYPEWGAPLETLVLSLIALHQLVGPVLFRAALARAGEVGKVD